MYRQIMPQIQQMPQMQLRQQVGGMSPPQLPPIPQQMPQQEQSPMSGISPQLLGLLSGGMGGQPGGQQGGLLSGGVENMAVSNAQNPSYMNYNPRTMTPWTKPQI